MWVLNKLNYNQYWSLILLLGAGTGDGAGAGTGDGTGAGTGDGIGDGTGEGTGDGTGDGIGEGTGEGDDPSPEHMFSPFNLAAETVGSTSPSNLI